MNGLPFVEGNQPVFVKPVEFETVEQVVEVPQKTSFDDVDLVKFELNHFDGARRQQSARSVKNLELETFRVDLQQINGIDVLFAAEIVERDDPDRQTFQIFLFRNDL
jgi:hypothetical protein